MPRALNPNDPGSEPSFDCASIETWVGQLLPAGSEIAVRFDVPTDRRTELLVEERGAFGRTIDTAAERRVHDYTTGRVLARRAMQALGLPPGAVARGPGRAPRWPLHCIGSITHAEGLVGSAVARTGMLHGLGIDLELAERVGPSLHGKVLTIRELAELGATDAPIARQATLRFSAKEAVYKAVNPIVGRFIGFQEVEVTTRSGPESQGQAPANSASKLPAESGTFHVRYVGDHAANRVMESGSGVYCFFGRYVFTLFIIP